MVAEAKAVEILKLEVEAVSFKMSGNGSGSRSGNKIHCFHITGWCITCTSYGADGIRSMDSGDGSAIMYM